MRIEKDANGTIRYRIERRAVWLLGKGFALDVSLYIIFSFHYQLELELCNYSYSFVDVVGGDLEKMGPHGSCFHLQNLNVFDLY